LIAGRVNAARVIVPYFFRAYSRPDTVPGTPTASQPVALRPLIQEHAAACCAGSLFSKIEERLSAIGKGDGHEATAAQIAGGRIDHRQGISHGNGSIYCAAAALEDVDTNLRRKVLCGDHHALFSGHRPCRGSIGDRNRNQRPKAGNQDASRRQCSLDNGKST
jgi:hypothetical protein